MVCFVSSSRRESATLRFLLLSRLLRVRNWNFLEGHDSQRGLPANWLVRPCIRHASSLRARLCQDVCRRIMGYNATVLIETIKNHNENGHISISDSLI